MVVEARTSKSAGPTNTYSTSSVSTESVEYIHSDHLGSVSTTTNQAGAVVSSQQFDPWGKVRMGGISVTKLNYTGQHKDDTGLLYYHARYYDPSLARFVSADTIVPSLTSSKEENRPLTVDFHETSLLVRYGEIQGPGNPAALNRYAYVLNNPLRYTDPSGHDVDCGVAQECPYRYNGEEEAADDFYNPALPPPSFNPNGMGGNAAPWILDPDGRIVARVDTIPGSTGVQKEVHVYKIINGERHLVAIYTQDKDGNWDVAHKGNPYKHKDEFERSKATLDDLDKSKRAKAGLRRVGYKFGLTRTVIDNLQDKAYKRGQYGPSRSTQRPKYTETPGDTGSRGTHAAPGSCAPGRCPNTR